MKNTLVVEGLKKRRIYQAEEETVFLSKEKLAALLENEQPKSDKSDLYL